MNRLFFFFLPLFILGCKSKQSQVQETASSDSKLAFSFEKTACFGKCPEYVLTVFENGEAKFKGKKNTEFIGSFNCDDCDQEMVLKIMETAGRIKFWDLEDKYDPGVTDLPSVITTIYLKKPPKTVINVMDGPKELTELENQIVDFYLKRRWTKVN